MDTHKMMQEILDQIAARGAEGEVYLEENTQSQVQVGQGKVEKLSRSASKGLGVRAIHQGKMGYSYTSDFSQDEIEKTWMTALELALVADADEFRSLPALETSPGDSRIHEDDLDIFDPQVADLTMEQRVQFALEVEKAALEYDPRIIATTMCTYLDIIVKVTLANTNGFRGSYSKTATVGYLFAVARQAEETTLGIGAGGGVHLTDLKPAEIGREAAEKAVRQLGGKPVPTQQATVVFDPFITAELIYYLSEALSGEAMQRKRSFLAGKLGQAVAADNVTLLDNGRLPGGLGSAPFDGEGVPTRATRLLDEGILQAMIYDTYTARRDGQQSTGNSQRESHRRPPSLGVNNFYLQPGNQTPEEIIAGVENGFYVLNTMNVGGINVVSGDYSVGASGLWIENGKLTNPVNQVTIALPLDKLLTQIQAVGSDLRFSPMFGNIGAPTIRIDGVTIGGAK
ncbi:MAG: TldD/PmbA family protein [Anaerolineales bacterium]|nr:TldD/PmbA family protein [Anaerolineales bacterium]